MNKRENALDILRVICAFLVVAVHVYTVPFHTSTSDFNSTGIMTGAYVFYTVFRTIGELAVPCFIMLSGAFVIASKNTADYKSFYKKTWNKLCIPTIIFTVIYFIEGGINLVVTGTVPKSDFGMIVLYQLVATLYGTPESHMWYMFTLIGLYLICPCIVVYKLAIGEKAFRKTAFILWIWGTISNILVPAKYFWSLGFVVNMLGLFLLGYVAHEWGKSKRESGKGFQILCIGILVIAIFSLIRVYIPSVAKMIGGVEPFSPFVGVSAFFIVAAFSAFDFKKELGMLSASTFWVYLCHPLVMLCVFFTESKLLKIPYNEIGEKDKWIIPNISLVIILVLSFVVGCLIERIVNAKLYRKDVTN